MSTATGSTRRPTMAERMRVPRSRGATSGGLLVLLGIWGALIPFIGPIFGYAYTPDVAWDYTTGRLWLEILPGAATVLGGLILMRSASRAVNLFGGWLAAVAGAWFVVGQPLSVLWNGVPAAGHPAATGAVHAVLENIGFFSGLGATIVFFGAFALGRLSVVGIAEVRQHERRTDDDYGDDDGDERRTGRGTRRGMRRGTRRSAERDAGHQDDQAEAHT